MKVTFVCVIVLLALGVSGALSERKAADKSQVSPRMPMHRTSGIFDLLSPITIIKVILKIIYKPFSLVIKNFGPIVKAVLGVVNKFGHAILGPLLTPAVATVAARALNDPQLLDMLHHLTGDEFVRLLPLIFPQQ